MGGEPLDYLVLFGVAVTCIMNVVTALFLHRISRQITGGWRSPSRGFK